MRNHVINELVSFSYTKNNTFLITDDLGFHVVEGFQKAFPDRYLNAGIAEQNMCSIAAGIAHEGNMVFMYSIGNFPTLRCIEQIRNNVCYHNENVKILSVGGGFAYGGLGMTHHATEDIAMMRALPNMRVYVPSDEVDAVACFRDAVSFDGPAFIRMARGKEAIFHALGDIPNIHGLFPDSNVGTDVNVLSVGTLFGECQKLRNKFADIGLNAGAFSVACVKPLPVAEIKRLANQCKLLITMEEHNVIGGFGGAVAEVLSEMQGEHAVLFRAGLQDCFTSQIGDQEYLRRYYRIAADEVFELTKGFFMY